MLRLLTVIALAHVGLCAGQVAADDGPPSLAERAFRAITDPKFSTATRNGKEVLPPPHMPALPPALRFERSWQDGKNCGPVSLYFFLRLNRVSVTLDEVKAALTVSERGTTLADLVSVAERFGVRSEAIKITPEDLGRLPKPAILHYTTAGKRNDNLDHYDVLVGDTTADDGKRLHLIDTSNCLTYERPASVIGPELSGYALVPVSVSRDGRWLPYLWAALAIVVTLNLTMGVALLRRRWQRSPVGVRPDGPAIEGTH